MEVPKSVRAFSDTYVEVPKSVCGSNDPYVEGSRPGRVPGGGWATQCGVAIESIPVVQLLELLVQVVQLLELLVQVASSGISVAEP